MWEQFLEEKKRKWLFPLAVFLALNVLFLIIFTLPSGKKLENKNYDIQEALKSAALAEKNRDKLQENLDRIQRARKDIEQFKETRLLKREGGFQIVREKIGEITRKEGVDPESIAYNPKYMSDYDLTLFSMKIPLGGAYQSLRRFISGIEESEYFLVIKEIEMKELEEKRGKEKVELGVILLTYFVGK